MAQQLRPVLDRDPALPVLMSDRMVMAALLYYLRDRLVEGAPEPGDGRRPTWMWDWNKVPENHYEMLDPYTGAEGDPVLLVTDWRSEEHTSDLQSLMRISYAVFCLKKHNQQTTIYTDDT